MVVVWVSSNPPTADEIWRTKQLADYNIMDGSWYCTRSIFAGDTHVGFYVLHRNYLSFLHIFANYRRRGYGRKVVNQLCAGERGLYLHSTPTARPFWERCGFKTKQDGDGGESDRACVEMAR
jgi:GNAT superfamily N-acetyltransferase